MIVAGKQARAPSMFSVLGVSVDSMQIPSVIERLEDWICTRKGCRYVAVTGMHGVTEAHHDAELRNILNSADMVVPDGMPLVWIARLRGHPLKRRVYGPELMLTFFEMTVSKGYRHFLYGGAPGLPERLAATLQQRFPGTIIAGTHSPPFRALSTEEDAEIVGMINRAAPDVVWVGLSTPKQERWMYNHRETLTAPVLVGVGAAFDINSGAKKQAPKWMREYGLEWLFRLIQEPRRLWHRYLVLGSKFLLLVVLELIRGPRKPPPANRRNS